MSMRARRIFLLGVLVVGPITMTGSSPDFPEKWEAVVDLCHAIPTRGLNLAQNDGESIRRELLDPDLLRLVAKFGGLSATDIATIRILPAKDGDSVWRVRLGKSTKAFDVLQKLLTAYGQARRDGHTSAFLRVALANRVDPSAVSDSDLRVFAANRPMIPLSWLVKAETGTVVCETGQVSQQTPAGMVENGKRQEGKAGGIPKKNELCRWVLFTVVDGEVAWRYNMQYKANGSLDSIYEDKCDAKELDDRYQAAIKEVDQQVELEMKKEGKSGQLGACHTFWQLKKERLKAKGIEWRSPADLSPFVIFD